ncbi:LysM peptidoglycan-binding domain-containing protein [Pseudomonadota bacterium]
MSATRLFGKSCTLFITAALAGCQGVPQKDQPAAAIFSALPSYTLETSLAEPVEQNTIKTTTDNEAATAPLATTDPIFIEPTEPVLEPAPDFSTDEPEAATETIAAGPLSVEKPPAVEAPPIDLWERTLTGYKLSIPNNSRIDHELKWFTSHADYVKRIQTRAQPYLYFILEEVEKRNMPSELALLPVVESAFQPFAYSPGRAAGLWQFIPSTGKHFGLKQNWWYDGRRDVVSATRAALDYLQALANRFDGDWELALASYNAGASTVSKAIRKNKRRGKATDFWSLSLPRETKSYVPRLLAFARLLSESDKLGIRFTPLPNQPHFASVDIGSQLDLALAAEMAEISIQDLYHLNPGFNRWATDPQGPHRLQFPIDKVEGFKQKLAALDNSKRLSWKRYKIRNGDNLGAIARKHNTTVAVLQQVNKIRSTRIRAGKHLLIPVSTKSLKHYAFSAQQRKSRIQNSTRTGTKVSYTVRSGDTLWDISRAYKVSHRKLAKWNSMAPRDMLRPGQKLVIWVKKQQKAQKLNIASLPPHMSTGPTQKRNSVNYRVRKGDSLSRIASRFNVSVTELRKWNRLPSKYLQPGQRIKLYVDITQQTL